MRSPHPGWPAGLLALTLLIPGAVHAGARQEGRAVMPAEAQERQFQQDWGYASALVSGDTVYLSGVVAGVREGETEVSIDLQAAFAAVYDRAGYDYSLDYARAVVPPLDESTAAWARGIVSGRRRGA